MRPLRLLLAVLIALGASTPASAQFKKLKDALGKKSVPKPAEPEPSATAPADADGGLVVLTPAVVAQILAGSEAAQAERDKAVKEDTPYGRYTRAKAAAEAAKPKCQAAQAAWGQRAAGDEKLMNRYSAAVDQAMAAQQKGDMAGYEAGMYQALGLIDPSCAVKDPEVPDGQYDAQRAVEERAHQAELKAAGLTDREHGMVSDRIVAILTGTEPPGGASPAERSAVEAKAPQLKSKYGIHEAQEARLTKQAPAPEPTPTRPQVTPPTAAPSANDCMVNNVQQHQAEIQALGDRGTQARDAGNTALMMAIADSITRIQMAGCTTK
jgi:hypothetical protein